MSDLIYPGWTLTEAFERIVPEFAFSSWLKYMEWQRDSSHHNELLRGGRYASRVGGFIIEDDLRDISEKYKESTKGREYLCRKKIFDHLKNIAKSGAIVAYGTPSNISSDAVFIRPNQWATFSEFSEETSTVSVEELQGKFNPSASFLGVLFYPVLRSPNASTFLSELLLSDILDRFVWRDPEALKIWDDGLKRSDRLPNDVPGIASDRGGLLTLQYDAKKMRLEIDRVELSDKLGLGVVEAGGAASHYLDVLADRLTALGEIIATDRIGLIGLDGVSGERVSIDPVDLETGRLLLCLKTGGLYRPGDGNSSISNVRVVEPSAASGVSTAAPNDDGVPSSSAGELSQGKRGRNEEWDWDSAIASAVGKLLLASYKDKAGNPTPLKSLKHLYEIIQEECEKQNGTAPKKDTVEDKVKKNDKYKIIFRIASYVLSEAQKE